MLDIAPPPRATYQVHQEVLAALATATVPLTAADLADHCPSAADRTAISRAVYDLRNGGQIAIAETRASHTGRGARPVNAYRITDAGRAAMESGGITRRPKPKPPADPLPGALADAPDEDRNAAIAAFHNGEPYEPQLPQCPTCAGDDHAAPCAYPSEDQPGCLHSQSAPERRRILDEIAALGMPPEPANGAEPDDDVLVELDDLSDLYTGLVQPFTQAHVHARRLRALAGWMIRLVNQGDQTVNTYAWLMELADLIDQDATRTAR